MQEHCSCCFTKSWGAAHVDWSVFYNQISVVIGIFCIVAFITSAIYMLQAKRVAGNEEGGKRSNLNADMSIRNFSLG